MNISAINKEFRIVFQKKDTPTRVRFLVGAGKLKEYIGESNASTCFKKAMESKNDKVKFEFRKAGTVIFYVK